LLHFVLWSHRRSSHPGASRTKDEEDEEERNDEDRAYRQFLDALMIRHPDAVFRTGTMGYTPLHVACSKESTRTAAIVGTLLVRAVPVGADGLEEILKGACVTGKRKHVDGEDGDGDGSGKVPALPPLPSEVIRRIVQYLPNAALAKDERGQTPLFLACQAGRTVSRRDLLGMGAELRRVAELLLRAAPEAGGMADGTGRTPNLELLDLGK